MNTKQIHHTLFALLILCLSCIACSEAKDYDDPEPDIVVSQDPGQSPDPGTVADPGNTPDEGAPEDPGQTPDISEASDPGPTPEDLPAPPDDQIPSDVQVSEDSQSETPEECICTFQLWATQPNPQSFVWLTGDFLDPTWPALTEDGALEMLLEDNGINAVFSVALELSHNQSIEYKYLLGWDDNPGPHWADQSGNSDPSLPNSIFTVDCAIPCSVGP